MKPLNPFKYTLEKLVEGINIRFDKSRFEYGLILNARRYYNLLYNYSRGRFEEAKETRNYLFDLYNKNIKGRIIGDKL